MEKITIHPRRGGVDDAGNPVPGGLPRSIIVKSIQPLSLEEMSDEDKSGTIDSLRVWTGPGVEVHEGDQAEIRGLIYLIRTTAWDWSVDRRPVVARHRPGVVFDCERGAG